MFDKGKWLGIYFFKVAARLQFMKRPTGVSVDPSHHLALHFLGFPKASSPAFWMCLFCYEGIS